MLSYLNMAIVKIPFCSRVMGFSNSRPLLLFSLESFIWQQWYWGAIGATPRADDL